MSSYTKKTKIIFLDLPNKLQENLTKIRKIYDPEAVKRLAKGLGQTLRAVGDKFNIFSE